MIGLVSLGDAAREGLRTAALQTHTSSDALSKFTDATGRTFVEPNTASMDAAAKLLKPDTATRTWKLPYDTLRSQASAANAYPGTMVVYGALPTRGLKAADASDYAKLLTFAATTGQHPGTGEGKLPDGFLPMTAANGLGTLVDYTQRASAAVAAQQGALPPLIGSSTPSSPSTSGAGGGGSSGGSGSNASPSSPPSNGVLPTSSLSKGKPSPTPTSTTALPSVTLVGQTQKLTTGAAGIAIPILAGVVLVSAAAALGIRLQARPRRR